MNGYSKIESSSGEPVRLVIYKLHHLQRKKKKYKLTIKVYQWAVRILSPWPDVTMVSQDLVAVCSSSKPAKGDQSARFSRPATKERILQEFSVPSADTSCEETSSCVERGCHTECSEGSVSRN